MPIAILPEAGNIFIDVIAAVLRQVVTIVSKPVAALLPLEIFDLYVVVFE